MKNWTRSGKAVVFAAVTAIMTAVSGVTAFAEDETAFVVGTQVNGIGIGGMTVEQAKAQIESFYAGNYTLTLIEQGGKEEEIKGNEIGFKVSLPEGLQGILDEQNASGRNFGPSVDNSHTMTMENVYDQALLDQAIDGLSAVSGSDIVMTANAYVTSYEEGQPFRIVEEVYGNNLDLDKTRAAIRQAVAAGQEELNLEQAGCYAAVTVTADNEALKAQCAVMNQCREMEVTYVFGNDTRVLDGETICSWITSQADGTIGVDQNKAAAFVSELAAAYDTAGTERTFMTASNTAVTLTGPYGWKIDQAAETAALVGIIQTGQSQTREPVYSQSAASRTESDWGGTYVEVDMGNQHVYMVKDHTLVWDAPCVTGNVSKNYTTPEGIYSLAYKQKDRILRGAKQADGTYEYESHVDYWMPFNGGIGLHDADWRSSFGGSIYKTNGSHGCINLPPDKAAALYDLIDKGTPVICHN
ncbi:MAG TPA: L,D-transpeptidase family protein [Candidatus Cottocaccamicrobium excrementipullorum]|nr:L,D-transpeptidase family protein [Candidatus Cottocaccamicrobium excrementipullorum]